MHDLDKLNRERRGAESAQLDAARAMLAALSDIVDMRAIMRTDDTRFARFAVDKARAAIATAKAAGITAEG